MHLTLERVADAPSHYTTAHTHAIARASEGAPVAAANTFNAKRTNRMARKRGWAPLETELDRFRVT